MNKILLTILWLTSIAIAVYAGKQLNTQSANPIELSHSPSSVENCPSIDSKAVVKPERSASTGKLCLLEQQLAESSVDDVISEYLNVQTASGLLGVNMEAQVKFFAAISQMREEELADALRLANQQGDEQKKMQAMLVILAELAKVNPHKALSIIDDEFTNNKSASMARFTAIGAWASQDPDAALDWFVGVEKATGNRDELFMHNVTPMLIFGEMARKDLNHAFSQIAKVPQEENVLSYVAMGLMQGVDEQTDISHVLNELNAHKSPAMMDSAIRSLSGDKPEQVALWLDQQESSKALDDRRFEVTTQWINSTPNRAMTWYLGDKEGEERVTEISKVMMTWGMNDPKGALEWVDRQRDIDVGKITRDLLSSATYSNPSFTVANLHRLTDEKSKKEISERVIKRYYEQDKEATLAFIESSPFRESLEQKLAEHKKEQGYN